MDLFCLGIYVFSILLVIFPFSVCMCQFWRVEEFFSLNTASFKDQ